MKLNHGSNILLTGLVLVLVFTSIHCKQGIETSQSIAEEKPAASLPLPQFRPLTPPKPSEPEPPRVLSQAPAKIVVDESLYPPWDYKPNSSRQSPVRSENARDTVETNHPKPTAQGPNVWTPPPPRHSPTAPAEGATSQTFQSGRGNRYGQSPASSQSSPYTYGTPGHYRSDTGQPMPQTGSGTPSADSFRPMQRGPSLSPYAQPPHNVHRPHQSYGQPYGTTPPAWQSPQPQSGYGGYPPPAQFRPSAPPPRYKHPYSTSQEPIPR